MIMMSDRTDPRPVVTATDGYLLLLPPSNISLELRLLLLNLVGRPLLGGLLPQLLSE